MDAKDLIYATSIAVTLGLGIWNFVQGRRAARRASFINTVTSQRVLWIERFRQDVSRFVGLTHHWTRSHGENNDRTLEILKEIDTLRYVIRLRLNPDAAVDNRIAELIREIPDLTDVSRRDQLEVAINELVNQSQQLLKAEWEKVKAEAKDGDLKEISKDT